jgi:hypothetical protein
LTGDSCRDPRGTGGDRARRWRRWLTVALIAIALTAVDLARPPTRQVSGRLLCAGIAGYQATLSRPLSGLGVRCRFAPTCSRYAETCVRRFGAGRGGLMAFRRLLRCGPWTPALTVDPPPAALAPDPPPQ